VFFLILARRGLYGGMRMGMSSGNDRHENGNSGRTGMTEQEWWQNTGMADYSYSLNSSRDLDTFVSVQAH
jgi:hypothetical protein